MKQIEAPKNLEQVPQDDLEQQEIIDAKFKIIQERINARLNDTIEIKRSWFLWSFLWGLFVGVGFTIIYFMNK